MALEQSILNSVKKTLGLADSYDAFDEDVIMHINSAFFTLNQLGLGPTEGFMIEDDAATWVEFTGTGITPTTLNAVKSYIYLFVRLIFDPPSTPHHIQAAEDQKSELTHRLLTERELRAWTPPPSLSPSLP